MAGRDLRLVVAIRWVVSIVLSAGFMSATSFARGSGVCGEPGSGDCQADNGTPGCEDADCCALVCAVDSFCCDSAWDATCAGLAATGCFDGPPPANDECQSATDLSTGDRIVAFSTLGATTTGADLPASCESFGSRTVYRDVWFRWVASTTGPAIFSTCNAADFDTRIAVFEGGCDALNLVGCNNDALSCDELTSRLETTVVAGTAYLVQVGSWAPLGAGSGLLTICEGDECLGLCTTGCEPGDGTEGEGCQPGINDGCNASPELVQSISIGDTICGSFWALGGERDTDWFEFDLQTRSIVTWEVRSNIATTLLILSTECPEPVFEIGGVVDGCPGIVEACLEPGTHRVFVAPGIFGGLPCADADANRYRATLNATPVGPVDGDTCAAPIVLGTLVGETIFDTGCAATDGANLPASCQSLGSVQIQSDIFFEWTVPTAGDWRIGTCGAADFDTWIAAWDGCGGTVLGCANDTTGCLGGTSSIDLSGLQAGATVLIQIGSLDGAQGSGSLTIESLTIPPPSNDDCVNATPLSDGLTPISTIGATTDGGQLPAECNSLGNPELYNDVWYQYSPSCGGTVKMSFCEDFATTLDTKMAVYDASCDGALLACSDDACGRRSEVSFEASCGATYLVRIGSFAVNGFGTADLDVSCTGGSCATCPADLDGNGIVSGGDIGLLLLKWGDCPGCPEDLTGDGVVSGADFGLLLIDWGVCP